MSTRGMHSQPLSLAHSNLLCKTAAQWVWPGQTRLHPQHARMLRLPRQPWQRSKVRDCIHRGYSSTVGRLAIRLSSLLLGEDRHLCRGSRHLHPAREPCRPGRALTRYSQLLASLDPASQWKTLSLTGLLRCSLPACQAGLLACSLLSSCTQNSLQARVLVSSWSDLQPGSGGLAGSCLQVSLVWVGHVVCSVSRHCLTSAAASPVADRVGTGQEAGEPPQPQPAPPKKARASFTSHKHSPQPPPATPKKTKASPPHVTPEQWPPKLRSAAELCSRDCCYGNVHSSLLSVAGLQGLH